MSVIKHQVQNGILILTLNRPEKLNALNASVLHLLAERLAEAKDQSDIKGILLHGEGRAFCAGADIARLAECDAHSGYQFACFGQSVLRQLETLGKPSIAAIHGYAFGGGCELAMATSLRIAAHDAQFAQPEIKLGVIPGYGGTQRLMRLIGKGRALDLCLSGRVINADTALQWGLVNTVVPVDALIDTALQQLHTIISMAPLALTGVMDAINYGCELSLDAALHLEAIHFAKVCASQDKEEGVAAFLEKRQAVFQGA